MYCANFFYHVWKLRGQRDHRELFHQLLALAVNLMGRNKKKNERCIWCSSQNQFNLKVIFQYVIYIKMCLIWRESFQWISIVLLVFYDGANWYNIKCQCFPIVPTKPMLQNIARGRKTMANVLSFVFLYFRQCKSFLLSTSKAFRLNVSLV